MPGKTKQLLKGLVQGGFPQYLTLPYRAKIQAQGEQRKSAQETEKDKNALLGKLMLESIHEGILEPNNQGGFYERFGLQKKAKPTPEEKTAKERVMESAYQEIENLEKQGRPLNEYQIKLKYSVNPEKEKDEIGNLSFDSFFQLTPEDRKLVQEERHKRIQSQIVKSLLPPTGRTFTAEDLEAIRWVDKHINDLTVEPTTGKTNSQLAIEIKRKLGVK